MSALSAAGELVRLFARAALLDDTPPLRAILGARSAHSRTRAETVIKVRNEMLKLLQRSRSLLRSLRSTPTVYLARDDRCTHTGIPHYMFTTAATLLYHTSVM